MVCHTSQTLASHRGIAFCFVFFFPSGMCAPGRSQGKKKDGRCLHGLCFSTHDSPEQRQRPKDWVRFHSFREKNVTAIVPALGNTWPVPVLLFCLWWFCLPIRHTVLGDDDFLAFKSNATIWPYVLFLLLVFRPKDLSPVVTTESHSCLPSLPSFCRSHKDD